MKSPEKKRRKSNTQVNGGPRWEWSLEAPPTLSVCLPLCDFQEMQEKEKAEILFSLSLLVPSSVSVTAFNPASPFPFSFSLFETIVWCEPG